LRALVFVRFVLCIWCLGHFQRVNKDQTACKRSTEKSAKSKRTETECEKWAIKEREELRQTNTPGRSKKSYKKKVSVSSTATSFNIGIILHQTPIPVTRRDNQRSESERRAQKNERDNSIQVLA
jgi:hypothetical protein